MNVEITTEQLLARIGLLTVQADALQTIITQQEQRIAELLAEKNGVHKEVSPEDWERARRFAERVSESDAQRRHDAAPLVG